MQNNVPLKYFTLKYFTYLGDERRNLRTTVQLIITVTLKLKVKKNKIRKKQIYN